MRQLVPTVNVWRGPGKTTVLPRAEKSLDAVSFIDMEGQKRTWAEALEKTWTDGVIVLHRGRVVYEKYTGALDNI